jgi:hypothetical protein
MEHEAGTETEIQEPRTPDRYGDVALGVECAWPERIDFHHDGSLGPRQDPFPR